MKRGFTLLELIVVIIIIGVLATLGLTQYAKVIEKGRQAEAQSVLGNIRTLAKAYQLEKGTWPTLAQMGLSTGDTNTDLPTACDAAVPSIRYYFSYNASGGANSTAVATRCGTGMGKTPGYAIAYTLTIDYDLGTITKSANTP